MGKKEKILLLSLAIFAVLALLFLPFTKNVTHSFNQAGTTEHNEGVLLDVEESQDEQTGIIESSDPDIEETPAGESLQSENPEEGLEELYVEENGVELPLEDVEESSASESQSGTEMPQIQQQDETQQGIESVEEDNTGPEDTGNHEIELPIVPLN